MPDAFDGPEGTAPNTALGTLPRSGYRVQASLRRVTFFGGDVYHKNMSKRPIVLIILTLYLVFTAFFAEYFVSTRLHHTHDRAARHGACSVCEELELAQAIIEGLGRIGAAVLAACFAVYAKSQITKRSEPYNAAITPVTLKVRLNT
jgi:hypothetical protein